MRKITEIIRGRKEQPANGITQNQFDNMIREGVITAPQSVPVQDRIEETGRTLYIPPSECNKIPGASVIVGEDGNPMCLIRVYQNARDPDSAIVKKLRIMED